MIDLFCKNMAASSFCDDKKFTFMLENSLVIFSVGIFHAFSLIFSRNGHKAYVAAKLNPGIKPGTRFDNIIAV